MRRCHVLLTPMVFSQHCVLEKIGSCSEVTTRNGMDGVRDLPTPNGVTAPRPVTTTLRNPSRTITCHIIAFRGNELLLNFPFTTKRINAMRDAQR